MVMEATLDYPKSTEPTGESTGPTTPTDQSDPTNATGPTNTTGQIDPTEPAAPTDRIDPSKTAGSSDKTAAETSSTQTGDSGLSLWIYLTLMLSGVVLVAFL